MTMRHLVVPCGKSDPIAVGKNLHLFGPILPNHLHAGNLGDYTRAPTPRRTALPQTEISATPAIVNPRHSPIHKPTAPIFL